MEQDKTAAPQRAVIELYGATCGNCVYTIEHVGRKIKGIEDVHVDTSTGKVYVEYRGENDDPLQKIVSVVERIGYTAEIVQHS